MFERFDCLSCFLARLELARMRAFPASRTLAVVRIEVRVQPFRALLVIVNAARIPPRPGYRPATDDQRQRGTGHKATEAEGSRDNSMVLGKSKRDRNCIRQ